MTTLPIKLILHYKMNKIVKINLLAGDKFIPLVI